MRSVPFALTIYRRYLEGETVEELAAGLGIPVERIEQRIRVAALYHERRQAPGRVTLFRLETEHTR